MPVFLSGSLIITGSMTTSGTITAQTLVVQTITSSIVNMTGSNIFGSVLTDRQTFTGSVVMTGSLTVNTTGTEFQVTNNGVVMGNLLTDNHSMTGSLRVTGSGTFSSTISAIGESTLFQGAYNDPVPNTVAVLKMSSTPTPSLLSTVVGARMSGSATANFDTYAGYFSNIALSSGNGMSYGIFATASFHTFIGETRFAQGVFNDPINGTAASVKISATPRSGAPTAVFTVGITGAASSGQNTFAGYFTNTSTVSGGGVNYGIYATGSSHYLGGSVGIGTLTPTSLLEAQANQNAQTGIRVRNSTAGTSAGVEFGAYTNSGNGGFGKYSTGNTPYKNISAASTYIYNGASGDIALLNDVAAGNISFAAGSSSTAQMFISASGNVGISTTVPSYKLDIRNDIAATSALEPITLRLYNGSDGGSAIYFSNSVGGQSKLSFGVEAVGSGTDDTYIGFSTGGNTALTERTRITSAGNVLIGGTSQLGSTTLSVFGSIAARNSGVDATYAEAFVAYYSANNTESNAILTAVSSAAGQSGFRFEVSNGAGSAARTNVLTLNRNSATFRGSDIRLYDASSNINAGYELLWSSNNGGTDASFTSIQGLTTSAGNRTGDLLFKTGNAGAPAEKLRIQSDGKIGITTAGANTYGWIYSIDVNHSIIIRGDRGGTASNYTNYYQYGGNLSSGLGHKFWTGGDLANQTLKLQIADNGIYMSSLGTGTVSATSGVLSTTSDRSYKTDAGSIENALDKVMNLIPRYFYWNEKSNLPNDIRQLGFYAQEVNEALGEEVANTPKSEDTPWGITDRSLIAFLTKAIQEQQAHIQELTAKVTALENK